MYQSSWYKTTINIISGSLTFVYAQLQESKKRTSASDSGRPCLCGNCGRDRYYRGIISQIIQHAISPGRTEHELYRVLLEYARMYNLDIINGIREILVEKKETLATAESVTSGHLQAAVSLATMATTFFQGGVTTYNIHQKTRLLNIDAVHALTCNCVSEKVASEMAVNAGKLFQSDWAISITGYAAPVPELGIDHLFAYWAISCRGELVDVDLIKADKGEPLSVQIFYTNELLKLFHKILKEVRQ